jgi:P22 coat protein - gene protein 5.
VKNLNHDYEKNFGSQMGFDGQKIGPTLNIRDPLQTTVRTGWAMQQQDVTETYHTLTIDTIVGTDLKFSDADLALSIDDFVPRYIDSPAKKLASVVDADIAKTMLLYTANNFAATAFAVPTTIDTYLGAGAMLKQALVPFTDGINVAISPQMERKIVSGLAGQYNPQGNISEMFLKGQMSNAAGLDWYMSQLIPAITIGTDTTAAVGTFVAATGTSLPYTGNIASGTAKAGQVITIAGLYDVNFETKTPYQSLKQFVVTADNTASNGAGTLSIFPAIVFDTASPVQNCYIASGSINAAAVTYAATDGSANVTTTPSATYQQSLVWHKDAFAFASVPLMLPKGLDMASTASFENLNFRFLRGYDIANARLLSRMDLFYGKAQIRPQWCAKGWTV